MMALFSAEIITPFDARLSVALYVVMYRLHPMAGRVPGCTYRISLRAAGTFSISDDCGLGYPFVRGLFFVCCVDAVQLGGLGANGRGAAGGGGATKDDSEWIGNLAAQREHGIVLGAGVNGAGGGAAAEQKVSLTKEESYVPLAFAKERIASLTVAMHEQRNKEGGSVSAIIDHYDALNRATLKRWEEHMANVKKEVRVRIAANLDRINQLQHTLKQREEYVADLEKQLQTAQSAEVKRSLTTPSHTALLIVCHVM